MNCRPIGTVKSRVTEGVDQGWGDVVSEIRIDSEFAPGLLGLESFSHVIVVFDMHRSTWTPGSAKPGAPITRSTKGRRAARSASAGPMRAR